MQIVDILGDDRRNLAGPVERGERAVTAARLCRGKGRLHRKTPPPGFGPRVRAGDEFIEGDRAVADTQSPGRTEIGNSGFSRDAGAGKGNDRGGCGDHVAELFHAAAKIWCNHVRFIRWSCHADYSMAGRMAASMPRKPGSPGTALAPPSGAAAQAALAIGSLASSLFFSSLFLALATGAAWDFFASRSYCASFSSSASSSARRAETFSSSLSVAFSRNAASSSMLSESRSFFAMPA